MDVWLPLIGIVAGSLLVAASFIVPAMILLALGFGITGLSVICGLTGYGRYGHEAHHDGHGHS